MIRLHLDADLKAGATVAPSPEQSRYLTAVMRRGVGDELLVFNGRDGEWLARVVEAGRRGCTLTLQSRTRAQDTGPDVELVVALVKRSRLETIVEKAVELGARRVALVTTRFTNVDRANPGRLRAIMIEAAEQTGRLDVPTLADTRSLERVLDGWDPLRRLVFCDEAGGAPPLADAAPRAPVAILIGPEGGFAPEERERLHALPFVVPVSLGPRILRADTAAIAALALWQAAAGDGRALLPGADRTP